MFIKTEYNLGDSVYACYLNEDKKEWQVDENRVKLVALNVDVKSKTKIDITYIFDRFVNNQYAKNCTHCQIFQSKNWARQFQIKKNIEK